MLIRTALFAVIGLWVAGIFAQQLVPLLPFLAGWLPFINKSYSVVCHQNDAKLISLFGGTTMVCARCLGIYMGALVISLALLLLPRIKLPDTKILLAAAAVVFTDVLLTTLGIYPYTKTAALFTGVLLGSLGFLYFYNTVRMLTAELKMRNNINGQSN